MIVVVGGHSRNIGKTTVMCRLIAATRDANWTAVKITQHGHSVCSNDGAACDCAPADAVHPFVVDEQATADETDSGRYLQAGAVRSYWLRTRSGQLAEGMDAVRKILATSANVIIESNSIMDFLTPDAYVFVRDPRVADFKLSAQRHVKRATRLVAMDEPAIEEWFAQTVFRRT